MIFLKKIFVSFIKSRWNLATIVAIYIFMVLIPLYYTINNQLTPQTRLNRTDGLFHKIERRRGTIIRLSTANGDIFFSCRNPHGFSVLPVRDDKSHFAEGKLATIYWYKRDIYLGKKVNYIVELKVGNDMIIARSKTEKNLCDDIDDSICMTLILTIVFVLIYKHNNRFANRLNKKCL